MTDGAAGSATTAPPVTSPGGAWRSLAEPRFLAWAAVATVGSLLAFGVVSAIIPNPVFGREIPPEPFAIAVWLVSAPLMGVILATYLVRPPAVAVQLGVGPTGDQARPAGEGPTSLEESGTEERRTLLGYVGGFAAFLAIGCPVCNKIALVALGTSGALTIWAPLQPVIGAASIVLLAATVAWRLRVRSRGGACSVA